MTNSAVSPQAAAQELLRRRQARRGLLAFTQYTFGDYEVNWHHELVCSYLDRFVAGEILRLMIFQPPRTGKSELVSRRLPAYILGRNPDAAIIAASYSADLARRMNRDVQRIMDSPEYLALYPETRLFGENVRTVAGGAWLRNSDMFEVVGRAGVYRSTGIGGGITGTGMHYGIVDDPVKNRQEANSETVRESIWSWYTSTFRTRLAPGGGILLTVTRWHEDDLAGRLLKLAETDAKADQWVVVSLPAIAEEPVATYDRRRPGEALWPERFGLDDMERTRVSLGSFDWNALYQQRPRPLEGGIIKQQWLKMTETLPPSAWRIRYWDKAATAGGGAYTSGVRLSIAPGGAVTIEDVRRGQWSTGERRAVMRATAEQDGTDVAIGIEQEPGSSGVDSVQDEIRLLAGWAVFADRPSGSKDTRMLPFAAQAEGGNVFLVRAAWNDAYIDELVSLPNGRYRDQADASSGAYNRLIEIIHAQAAGTVVYDEPLSISPY